MSSEPLTLLMAENETHPNIPQHFLDVGIYLEVPKVGLCPSAEFPSEEPEIFGEDSLISDCQPPW